jgi:predicted nucleic acid-binding protein
MNEWLVVDASVILKAFVQEEGSDHAGLIWSSETFLAAPAHALAEVGEALRRKWARGEVTEAQIAEACLAVPGSILSIAVDMLFEPAMAIARAIPVGFYDCLYLAAADRLDCRLVTADRKFLSAAVGTEWIAQMLPLDSVVTALRR